MPILTGTDETAGGAWMNPYGISFRELRLSDLDRMHRCLNTPQVRRWWSAEGTSYVEIETEYLIKLSREGFERNSSD